jgi:hypothetical protein
MSDGALCACLQVMYQTKSVGGGGTTGWWACKLCGNEFIPKRAAEYMVREAVRSAKEEVEDALEEKAER